MKSRVLFALIAAALLVSGCSSNNNNEWQRVVCSVQAINGGVPFVSAALNIGTDVMNTTDDYVPLDIATVLFWARPSGSLVTIPEEGAYSAFIITSYDATWTPGPGAPAALTDYNVTRGQLSARVPINDEVAGVIHDRAAADETGALVPFAPQPTRLHGRPPADVLRA